MTHLVKASDAMTTEPGARPPSAIDARDNETTAYWAYRLNISPDELFEAIQKVGTSVAAIRRHLGK